MSFNSFRRRGRTASKSVIKASLSQISEAQRTLEDTGCLVEYHGIDEEDVQVLNNPASDSKDDPSAISEDEGAAKQQSHGGETNQQCTEVRSEEYAVLSDSTEDMEELERCYRGSREAVVEPQSTSERIDDWCLTHVSCGTSTVLEAASTRVRDIARSWGVEGDVPATLPAGAVQAPACALPHVSSYESRRLAQLTPAELTQLTKFVKELLPYLIQGRASVRAPRCETRYRSVPTLFPDRSSLLRCSLDVNNVSKMANLYQQMRQLLLDAPSDGSFEALDDISLSSMHSSLPVQSWYGWHMVPRVRDSEF
ncbi:AaceriAEL146Cp [[Ashbya] aceris (nom. inval.)]|nr:AaceriAEL146Cp [[Ashbya] aceris (nom. inval.)]